MLVNMHEAKTQLSKLVAAAEAGEEVIIARDGKPAVRLVPAEKKPSFHDLIGIYKDDPEWAKLSDPALDEQIKQDLIDTGHWG